MRDWESVPDEIRQSIARLRSNNTHYDYTFYGNEDVESFIFQNYGADILSIYRKINPEYGAARADLFRYLLIYKKGGVYIDIKSTFVRPIDDVIKPDDAFILAQWRNSPGEPHAGFGLTPDLSTIAGGEFQQWHLIASPGHPFLRAVIDYVLHGIQTYRVRRSGVGRYGILRLTGPVAYTLALQPLLEHHSHRFVKSEVDIGLEYSVLPNNSHRAIFKRHYTQNRSPIVLYADKLDWLDRLWLIFYPLANAAKGPARRFVLWAFRRRLAGMSGAR